MKRRILLLMMTALLSVGAWAENVWTGSQAIGWFKDEGAENETMHLVTPDFASCYSKIRKGDNIVVTVTITGNWSNNIQVYKANGTGWYVDEALTDVVTNYESSETSKKIVFPVTDAILEALAVVDTWGAHKLYFYGNGETVTSVDVEYNNGKATIYDGQVQAYGWGYQLLPHLFTLAQAGDVLSIDVSNIGSTDWGASINIANKSHNENNADPEYEDLLSANPGTSVPTTVKFVLTENVLTTAKSTGLYLNGGTYTYTSVDLLYAHAVTIDGGITNGTVTASKSKAVYGETVTLTAAPDAGYALVKPTVTDENSDNVAVTDNGDGTYSFTMPATAVTVNATFTSATALSTDRLIIDPKNGGSIAPNGGNSTYRDLWVANYEYSGWDLTVGRPVTTDEFAGIQVLYKEAKNIKMQVIYGEGNTVWTSDVIAAASGTSNILSVNFADKGITGVVKSIKFFRNSDADTMIQFESTDAVSLKTEEGASASTPASSLTLTYGTLMDGGSSSVEYDNTDSKQQFEIKSGDGHWAGWIFTLPISTTYYKGINFNMTSVPENGAIEIVYESSGTQTVKLLTGDNIVNFNHSGNITQIKFNVAGTYRMGTCSASNTYLAKVTGAKYATYGAVNDAIDYSKTSGLKAYIAYVEDNKVKLTEVTKVPANTAVVLYHETAGTYTLSTTTEDTDNVSANKLHISDGTVEGDGSTIYVLANKTPNGVGFYLLQNGKKVLAGKAYLSVSSGVATACEFIGIGDDTTGIDEVSSKTEEVRSDYFDLQGRRVAQPTKGLYIVNGKKVIVK